MNKVTYKPALPPLALPTAAGQIYVDTAGSGLYLVAKCDSNSYALIHIETGNRLVAPVPYAALVPKGFELAEGLITIDPNVTPSTQT